MDGAIKPYYLVAIPEGAIVEDMLRLQKYISEKFRMYDDPFPSLHLTVGIIESGTDIRRTFPLLEQITDKHLPLIAHIKGQRCFNKPFFTVGLAAESVQIAYLAGEVEGKLSLAGFNLRSFAQWHFHISLISPLYSKRLWNEHEFREACQIIAANAPDAPCIIKRIELWDPEFPPLNILARFSSG